MNNTGLGNNRDLALLLLRLGVGLSFIVSGWGKLTGIEGTASFFGNIGIPLAGVMAWVVALVETFGALMVIIGFRIKIPSLLLAFIMVVAIFTVKLGDGFSGMRLELMLLLTSLALAILGPGKYSVDARMDKKPAYSDQ